MLQSVGTCCYNEEWSQVWQATSPGPGPGNEGGASVCWFWKRLPDTEAERSGLSKLGGARSRSSILCVTNWLPRHPSHTVVKFMDVYQRSYCRPIETLVDIFQEYPDEIEYIFKPSCVPLMRCAGCCNDEALECVPTSESNITMQVGT